MDKKIKLCAFADEAGESLDEQIKALKENDISLLEIRGVNGKNISELTPAQVNDTAKKCRDAGIMVWAVGSPIGKININDPFEPHLDLFCRLLEYADILKASCFRLFSFYGTGGGMEDIVLERLNKFTLKSKGSNIKLCHENESGIYGDIAARCLYIHENIPEIKAIFDPANFIQCSQDTIEAWELLNPYVEYIHVKDALQDGTVVPAGAGDGNVQTIIKQFIKKGGTLTLEPHLFEFVGLRQLESEKTNLSSCTSERTSKIGSLAFTTGRAAFDAAAEALKEILNNIMVKQSE